MLPEIINHVLLYVGSVTLVFIVGVWWMLLWGSRQIRFVRDLPVATGPLPKISIVAPARNEERNIEHALRSVLNLQYEPLEILVVNDRSTDRTGEILERVAREHPQLRVVTVTDLPQGWLGKNHAMELGARQATGEFVLFTDADIVHEPQSLARAMSYVQEHQLDHLAIAPDIVMPSWFLQSFGVTFTVFFSIFARPWKARDPKSTAHIGIGAFNLVRRTTLEAVNYFEPIRMRPDDDIMLGKLIKMNGYRQDMLAGTGTTSVEWYATWRELVLGLEKNTFAALDYNPFLTVGAVASVVLVDVFPVIGAIITHGWTQVVYIASSLMLLVIAWGTANGLGLKFRHAILFPLCCLLFAYINIRSMCLCLARNGIRWRDTHYSLAELRANRL